VLRFLEFENGYILSEYFIYIDNLFLFDYDGLNSNIT